MPADVLANEHFKARGSLVEVDLGGGLRGPIPSGFLEVDGVRAGPRTARRPSASTPTRSSPIWATRGRRRVDPLPTAAAAPLAGLRVADFGIGGVGVEVGRMLAEYGAEVLKVESRSYPDFIRLATGGEMSPSFASSSRSKLGFGANAKHPEGNRVLKELIARCDAVDREQLDRRRWTSSGLGYDELRAINPGLVMLSSQLMGSRGPWADFRGYGPSTRAAGGIEMLWNYDDQDEPAGGMSIFPDHLCGRIGALGILAGAARRRRGDGTGAHVELAQVEVTLGIVGDLLTKEALEPGSVKADRQPARPRHPLGPFPL